MGRASAVLSFLLSVLLSTSAVAQQDLGHKVLGTVGLDAGTQPTAGLYFGERAAFYSSTTLVDRNGNALPVGLDLHAFANGLGALIVVQLPWFSTYYNAAFAVPLSHVTLNSVNPAASIDQFGLGDLYVRPVDFGWRLPHCDLGVGYAFYAPTGHYEPGGTDGVGAGQWTNELSLSTAAFWDQARTWYVSALTSYDIYSQKRGIDVTRGSTLQIQGGVGKQLFRILAVGLVGYAEWQVTDNSGSALPAVLSGAHEQAFGLGPEVDVAIPWIRSKVTVRYTHDVSVKARPEGQLLLFGLTVLAWNLSGPKPTTQ